MTEYQYGIDICYRVNGKVNMDAVHSAGMKFVISQAGIGGYTDVGHPTYIHDARALGILNGAYWYLSHSVTPAKKQAELFVKAIEKTPLHYYAVDFENNGAPRLTDLFAFCDRFFTLMPGVELDVYTSPGVWNKRGKHYARDFGTGLWNADWRKNITLEQKFRVQNGYIASPWIKANFVQWGAQHVGQRKLDGDVFKGNLSQLASVMAGVSTPPPPVEPPTDPPPPVNNPGSDMNDPWYDSSGNLTGAGSIAFGGIGAGTGGIAIAAGVVTIGVLAYLAHKASAGKEPVIPAMRNIHND